MRRVTDTGVAAAVAAVAALAAAAPGIASQPAGGAILLVLAAVSAAAWSSPRRSRILGTTLPAAAIVWLQIVVYPMPAGVLFLGVVLGLLNALVALGMALVYRSNRILNFAQADLGTAPTVLAVGLIAFSGLSWYLAVPVGLAAALVLGSLLELVVVRRFFRAPRLILTVATIGISQLLTVVSTQLPRLWGKTLMSGTVDGPLHATFNLGTQRYSGDHLLAVTVVPALLVALTVFLRRTDVGVAVRASAERADRAAVLGVPVKRLGTLVWAIATAMSFVGLFLRASVVGLPAVSTLSFGALLAALAALVLGRLDDLPAITAAAVALGLLEQGIQWKTSNDLLVYPMFGAVVLVALVVRRTGRSRATVDVVSSWQSTAEVRPVPAELRRLRPVRLARVGGIAVGLVLLAALPLALGPSDELRAANVAVFVLIATSIVVLTGWAGQVSLGQMSFVAVGAAVGGVAVGEWGFDLSLALLVAGAAGAVVAIVVGLPALRLQGLMLAVTTLAFAVASSSYLLNRKQFSWLPRESIPRPRFFNLVDTTGQANLYYVCVGLAVLALVGVRRLRASRTGRALHAMRDNERGAQAFSVDVVRAKLLAFAVSGSLAAAAGCLHVTAVGLYAESGYAPAESFAVFTAAVVGGLGTLAGAVAGALFLNGGEWFLSGNWRLLPSAVGVLVVLLVLPGGLGELLYRLRDGFLRRVAGARHVEVPSLVADRAVRPHDEDPLIHPPRVKRETREEQGVR